MEPLKSCVLQKTGAVAGLIGFAVTAAAVKTGIVQPIDNDCFLWSEQHWTHAAKKLLKDVDGIVSPAHLLVASIVAALFILGLSTVSKRAATAADLRNRAALLVFMAVCSYGANGVLKNLFQRPRPLPGAHFSFPSDHAMMAFACFVTLAVVIVPSVHARRFRLLIVLAALLAAACIGLSRVYLGKHYLSDVLGGYFLGLLLLSLGSLAIAQFSKRRLAEK
ncbi:MAG: phosphatase PAP2 family protein [Sporolactobacillus sp.]